MIRITAIDASTARSSASRVKATISPEPSATPIPEPLRALSGPGRDDLHVDAAVVEQSWKSASEALASSTTSGMCVSEGRDLVGDRVRQERTEADQHHEHGGVDESAPRARAGSARGAAG